VTLDKNAVGIAVVPARTHWDAATFWQQAHSGEQVMKHKRRHGFTLVEVLIVVVILGILAATVLPQFTASTADAKEASLAANLATMRAQIQLYKFQHNGAFPAAGSTDPQKFIDQMTKTTDINGAVVPAGPGTFGPYLPSIPNNPVDTTSGTPGAVNVTASATDPTTPTGGGGWLYNPTTGTIKANVSTSSPTTNKAYFNF
jgi:prepilin-type N-terminal cleavage/methylation domain-containing protein